MLRTDHTQRQSGEIAPRQSDGTSPPRPSRQGRASEGVGAKTAISPPASSLPKGSAVRGTGEEFATLRSLPQDLPRSCGAIRGIGEKYAANPVTGTGSMTVPVFTSPGWLGFGPHLSLSYDSGVGAPRGAMRWCPNDARASVRSVFGSASRVPNTGIS